MKLQLQIPRQELRPPHPKTPIFPGIRTTAHDQIRTRHTTLLFQPRLQFRVDRLLHLSRAPLLEDLDEDELVGTREVEVRVFADYLVGFVLGYDLVAGLQWHQRGRCEGQEGGLF